LAATNNTQVTTIEKSREWKAEGIGAARQSIANSMRSFGKADLDGMKEANPISERRWPQGAGNGRRNRQIVDFPVCQWQR
jgi:hypothetical protein